MRAPASLAKIAKNRRSVARADGIGRREEIDGVDGGSNRANKSPCDMIFASPWLDGASAMIHRPNDRTPIVRRPQTGGDGPPGGSASALLRAMAPRKSPACRPRRIF